MNNAVQPLDLADFLTPKARAKLNARLEAREQALAAAREQLAAITDPLARAVLDLHAEEHDGTCQGDDIDGYAAERPDWPCRTTEVIAAHYGIALEKT